MTFWAWFGNVYFFFLLGKPESVTILNQANSEYPTSILVRWNPPDDGGAPIIHFTIEYRMVSVYSKTGVKWPLKNNQNKGHNKAFRFIVGTDHCPMISKYDPSLFMAVDPSFLVVKKYHFKKIFILQRVYELHKTESTCRLSIQ